ncbi:sulfurtransferase [Nesterenkonia massiliensis]|uniref:sulfurtransferase n=1 Tax=Nesterenkonia massiliensis TaxID=1232429 RepID=UPI00041B11B6|nr:sulfurtransferase [Nesterenkonia massiliensis]
MSQLISAEELHELVSGGSPRLRILDVRWRLDRPDGRPEYLRGHLPGAVYVDMDHELAEHGLPVTEGRHPLPSLPRLQAAARRWGLNDGDTVVVYDDMKNMSSARAWWLLRHAGMEDVRVLDGALQGWTDAGFPLEAGEVAPEPGAVTLDYGKQKVVGIDDINDVPAYGTLLDVRAAERFTGEHEPIDPRAGHIPGAVNAPTVQNVDAEGRFLPAEVLRQRFLDLGVDPESPVVSYCGSGINGAHATLALQLAGFDAALYPGSFSQWANHPEREVVTGESPAPH